jgi:hypothetical protein
LPGRSAFSGAGQALAAVFARGRFAAVARANSIFDAQLTQPSRRELQQARLHWDRCGVHYVEPIEGGASVFAAVPTFAGA